YPVAVEGPGSFTGHVDGTVEEPQINGHLKLSSIVAKSDKVVDDTPDQEVGALEADVTYGPKEIQVENGSLVRPDGSRADFSLNASLEPPAVERKDNISVKANVQNFDLPSLARVVPGLAPLIGRGTVTGTVDLKGLPGPRSIEGTANLSLTAV